MTSSVVRRERLRCAARGRGRLVAAAGGAAAVFGHSSGANLALTAAASGVPITKLALYEPPFVVDGSRPLLAADLSQRLTALVDSGRRGDAVELAAVAVPVLVIAGENRPPLLQTAAAAVAAAVANGRSVVLAGQTHDVVPEVTAPVVAAFLA